MLAVVLAGAITAIGQELSEERQREIIERYMQATGQTVQLPASLSEPEELWEVPPKCGTPAILEFQ
jgi:hypothetical protein